MLKAAVKQAHYMSKYSNEDFSPVGCGRFREEAGLHSG
jgi:hypothetical protein